MNIMTAIKKESANDITAETENGALGYKGHESAIVDFFYKVSSMRQWDANKKQTAFLKALGEDRELAFRMLFYIRDIRKGLGERQLFRDIFDILDPKDIKALFKLIPEYGRWDDVIDILRNDGIDGDVNDEVLHFIQNQFNEDLKNCADGKPISLLAKWMPSIRKVSKDKVRMAKFLAHSFGITEREYRKALSALRSHLKVVEKQMSNKDWGLIDFGSVPSKAAKNYRNAFKTHDGTRYQRYLDGLKTNETKVNAGAVYPYEIVHEYTSGGYSCYLEKPDELLEAQWKALPLPDGILKNAIVVRDGSGSMTAPVSGRSTALDVATSLAILMSENLSGEFKDKFITFSEEPRFVDLSGCNNLHQKVKVAMGEAECANTNIERTMNLILNAAKANHIPQAEIPTVIIVSDMEFDYAIDWRERNKPLFRTIAEHWSENGYSLPKIVFWNVNSRTGVVPLQENENGLILVSGFSQNIMDMLSGDGSMLDILRKKLSDKRYDPISEAIR